MNDLLAKLSSYDIFVNLIPGSLFVFFLSPTGVYTLQPSSVVGELVLYYFIGLVISRIGSVIIEPMLKFLRIVKYGKYSEFISASAKDTKILVLLEASNLYRTILALMLVCAIALNWDWMARRVVLSQRTWTLVGCGAVAALFLLSFRKQSGFISKRVDHYKDVE